MSARDRNINDPITISESMHIHMQDPPYMQLITVNCFIFVGLLFSINSQLAKETRIYPRKILLNYITHIANVNSLYI